MARRNTLTLIFVENRSNGLYISIYLSGSTFRVYHEHRSPQWSSGKWGRWAHGIHQCQPNSQQRFYAPKHKCLHTSLNVMIIQVASNGRFSRQQARETGPGQLTCAVLLFDPYVREPLCLCPADTSLDNTPKWQLRSVTYGAQKYANADVYWKHVYI